MIVAVVKNANQSNPHMGEQSPYFSHTLTHTIMNYVPFRPETEPKKLTQKECIYIAIVIVCFAIGLSI